MADSDVSRATETFSPAGCPAWPWASLCVLCLPLSLASRVRGPLCARGMNNGDSTQRHGTEHRGKHKTTIPSPCLFALALAFPRWPPRGGKNEPGERDRPTADQPASCEPSRLDSRQIDDGDISPKRERREFVCAHVQPSPPSVAWRVWIVFQLVVRLTGHRAFTHNKHFPLSS